MTRRQESILELTKPWTKSVNIFIGLIVNKMWKIAVGFVKSVLRKMDRLEKGSHLCKFTILALLSKESRWTYLILSSSGNRYLLVVVDCFTKWVEAFPLRNSTDKTIAKIFVNQVISRMVLPLNCTQIKAGILNQKFFKN